MSDIITKPVKREMLRKKVQEWVKKGQASEEADGGSSRSIGASTAASKAAGGARTGTHCMVLSSDKGQRTVLKGMLKMLGVVAHIAGDEEEALQVTQDVSPDWIMIDTTVAATLPQVGEIVGKIRQLISASKPVFALSDSDDYDGLMEAGFDEVVKKPLDRRDLSTLLARRTTFAGKGDEAAAAPSFAAPSSAPAGAAAAAVDQLRVLVVEDHWANRRLLEAMLLKQGHVMEVLSLPSTCPSLFPPAWCPVLPSRRGDRGGLSGPVYACTQQSQPDAPAHASAVFLASLFASVPSILRGAKPHLI